MENNLRFINLRIHLFTWEMRSVLAITLQDGEDKSAEYKSTVRNKSSLHVRDKNYDDGGGNGDAGIYKHVSTVLSM